MNLSNIEHLVNTVGAPMSILIALVYLLALLIKGPGMKVAQVVGETLADLVKRQIGQLATKEHVSLEHAETRATIGMEQTATRATIGMEQATTRATVEREHATTREHVSQVVHALRDRVRVPISEPVPSAPASSPVSAGAAAHAPHAEPVDRPRSAPPTLPSIQAPKRPTPGAA